MENYVLSGIQDQVAQIKKIPIRKVISEMGFGYV